MGYRVDRIFGSFIPCILVFLLLAGTGGTVFAADLPRIKIAGDVQIDDEDIPLATVHIEPAHRRVVHVDDIESRLWEIIQILHMLQLKLHAQELFDLRFTPAAAGHFLLPRSRIDLVEKRQVILGEWP